MRFFVLVLAILSGLTAPALSAGMLPGAAVPAMGIDGTPTVTGTINLALVPFTMTVTYGVPPLTFSLISGTFPTGVTINATTGVVSGTPTNSGTFANLVIQAEDSWAPLPHHVVQFRSFTMVIASPADAVAVSGTPTTTATVGTLMTPFTVSSAGGTGPYTYSLYSGYLPSGVTLGAGTGVVSGTPAANYDGTYTRIVIRSTDSLGAVGNLAGYDFVVAAASPAVALSLTATTPGSYIRVGAHSSGAILTMHGVTMTQRQSLDSLPADLDVDGNYTGSMWYAVDWPPGNLIPPSPDPWTVNDFTLYPLRSLGSSPLAQLRGGRVLGTVSSVAESAQLQLYQYATTNNGIWYPGADPDCYGDDTLLLNPRWANVTAIGAAGSTTLQSTAAQVSSSSLFVGEEVLNQPGVTAIAEGATIVSFTDAYHMVLSLPNNSAVTRATFRGCGGNYQNSAGVLLEVGWDISKIRVDHVHDALRTCSTLPSACVAHPSQIDHAWLTYCRDDCVEDDHNGMFSLSYSLLEGFVGISADQTGSEGTQEARAITLSDVMIHMIQKPELRTAPNDYGVPFKFATQNPSVIISKSIIAADGADPTNVSRYIAGWQRMTNGVGSCTSTATSTVTGLSGNYFLWLSDTPATTGDIGSMATPGSTIRNCFTYQTGATARTTWAAAKLALQHHLDAVGVYRLSSDP